MDLELDAEQLVLADAAASVLAEACPPALVRRVHERSDGARADREQLWATLCDLDWPRIGIPEHRGGIGLGFVEVCVLVEALGRVVAPTPYLATITQFAAAMQAADSLECLAEVADGDCTGTLAVAERGAFAPESPATVATPVSGGWRLRGTKTHVLDGATATELAVVAAGEHGPGVFLVPGSSVRAEPLEVMDPTLPLANVALDDVVVPPERVLVEPGDPRAVEVSGHALDAATAALALSTVATCRSILARTLEYVKQRWQFGRPIGSFQALKHRLADCYLAVERADALCWFAVAAVAGDDERRAVAVSMAKSAAGDCQRLLTRDGLQLHGGIGFTWEDDLHLYLKRAATGEHLFGTSVQHRARLARHLGLEPESGARP